MNVEQCIPKDKLDTRAVQFAETVGYPALNPVLPQLLEWLQDLNWPVALPVAHLLTRAGLEIVPPLRQILASNDSIWKYWILTALVPSLRREVREALRSEITRIADNPTIDEKAEEVDVKAKEVLALEK